MGEGKSFFSFMMIIAVLFMVVAVLSYVVKRQPSTGEMRDIAQRNIRVYVDQDTGVNYLIFDGYYQGGICPRYHSDGTLYVEEIQIEE